MSQRPMPDPTPTEIGQRHAMEAIARHAELLARQPDLPADAPVEAKQYRAAYVHRMREVAEWAWGKARA